MTSKSKLVISSVSMIGGGCLIELVYGVNFVVFCFFRSSALVLPIRDDSKSQGYGYFLFMGCSIGKHASNSSSLQIFHIKITYSLLAETSCGMLSKSPAE